MVSVGPRVRSLREGSVRHAVKHALQRIRSRHIILKNTHLVGVVLAAEEDKVLERVRAAIIIKRLGGKCKVSMHERSYIVISAHPTHTKKERTINVAENYGKAGARRAKLFHLVAIASRDRAHPLEERHAEGWSATALSCVVCANCKLTICQIWREREKR